MDYKIKIENKGKVEPEELEFAEDMIKHLYSITKGEFESISPKMFYILSKSEIEEYELGGFEFTILSSSFKGRIEVRKNNIGSFNLYFNKRLPTKGKFTYEFYHKVENILEKDILGRLDFCKEDSTEFFIKKGDVIMLNSGYIAIIRKYYSNSEIGINYDEEDTEVEEYIKKEDILKRIR